MNKYNAKDYLPLVQALADGKNIERDLLGLWVSCEDFLFTESPNCYRVKPEPEYPMTRFTIDELHTIFDSYSAGCNEFLTLANAAIRQAILDGDVILPEKK